MNWEGVVIHHSASPDVSANEIDRWHKGKGWKGIGYHFVIREDGTIEMGRAWDKQGAHARGKNTTHLGVCLTGDFTKYRPSHNQIMMLFNLLEGLFRRFDLKEVIGHHENCPGKEFPLEFFNQYFKE